VLDLCSDGDCLLCAGEGWAPGVVGHAVAAGGSNSQAGFTLLSARPVVMEDLRTETRFVAPPHLLAHGVVSGISVIIGAPEHPYGVLGAHTADRRSFTAEDVNFLQSVASLLAAAIARRRAFDARQHLLARAISAQEEERRRVARELHDETGQALSAILVGLRNLEEASTLPDARTLASRLRQLAADTVRDVGRIARGLRPAILDDLGLVPALRRYAEELGPTRHLRVLVTDDGPERLPAAVETTLYRIVQEALTNVARHAQARHAAVIIERHNGAVRATVQDDGTGFDVGTALRSAAQQEALGLLGMQERASLLGGKVTFDSRPGAGVTITVTLPVP
jgi:signal transduction histidine kinase